MWLVVLCPVFRMIYGFYIIYEHVDRVEKIASSKLAEQKEPHLCNLGWNNCVYVFNKQNKNFKCFFKDILRRLGQIHSNLYITISDSSKSCSDFSARYWQCISRFPFIFFHLKAFTILIIAPHLRILNLAKFAVSAARDAICIVVTSYSKSDNGEPSLEMWNVHQCWMSVCMWPVATLTKYKCL